MIGSLVNNIKTRLTSRVSDVDTMNISLHSTDDSKSRNLFNKFINASYSLISQHQDDAYCNENIFMLPRAYTENVDEPCRSPILLKPAEKSLDELDNIVDKFVRCISLENDYDSNVLKAHIRIYFQSLAIFTPLTLEY